MAHHGGAASPADAVTSVVPVPDAIAAIDRCWDHGGQGD
jgi:hypothetical protein